MDDWINFIGQWWASYGVIMISLGQDEIGRYLCSHYFNVTKFVSHVMLHFYHDATSLVLNYEKHTYVCMSEGAERNLFLYTCANETILLSTSNIAYTILQAVHTLLSFRFVYLCC